jgi:glucan phosphoethanolaminetransferase (alkaline phosphatase superfamily)
MCLNDLCFQAFALCLFTILAFFGKNLCRPPATLFRIFAVAKHYQKAFYFLKSI